MVCRDCGLEQSIKEYQEDIEQLKEQWICEFLEEHRSEMEIKKRLDDERYLLVELGLDGQTYVYLYDKDQKTSFLGVKEDRFDLNTFWRGYKQSNNYCLPCELILWFKKRLALAKDYAPVEMGL